ncbi:hypothetical protein MKZ38_003910 [Zalerion maritima]|uniref:Uncharacterized protein n=1 Tax=Zalerion maritima TaxID=339359 RepID=A0AAD5RM57_9PEZI|nr:hypothetical protein MKZ38_003910 [Zalerion maritima]
MCRDNTPTRVCSTPLPLARGVRGTKIWSVNCIAHRLVWMRHQPSLSQSKLSTLFSRAKSSSTGRAGGPAGAAPPAGELLSLCGLLVDDPAYTSAGGLRDMFIAGMKYDVKTRLANTGASQRRATQAAEAVVWADFTEQWLQPGAAGWWDGEGYRLCVAWVRQNWGAAVDRVPRVEEDLDEADNKLAGLAAGGYESAGSAAPSLLGEDWSMVDKDEGEDNYSSLTVAHGKAAAAAAAAAAGAVDDNTLASEPSQTSEQAIAQMMRERDRELQLKLQEQRRLELVAKASKAREMAAERWQQELAVVEEQMAGERRMLDEHQRQRRQEEKKTTHDTRRVTFDGMANPSSDSQGGAVADHRYPRYSPSRSYAHSLPAQPTTCPLGSRDAFPPATTAATAAAAALPIRPVESSKPIKPIGGQGNSSGNSSNNKRPNTNPAARNSVQLVPLPHDLLRRHDPATTGEVTGILAAIMERITADIVASSMATKNLAKQRAALWSRLESLLLTAAASAEVATPDNLRRHVLLAPAPAPCSPRAAAIKEVLGSMHPVLAGLATNADALADARGAREKIRTVVAVVAQGADPDAACRTLLGCGAAELVLRHAESGGDGRAGRAWNAAGWISGGGRAARGVSSAAFYPASEFGTEALGTEDNAYSMS